MSVLRTCILGLLCILMACRYVLCDKEVTVRNLEFCSFFNNRKPTPQPGLRNCTWFKNNSCCRQEELEATFMTVKPIPGSSPDCQRYTNYLMCYVCAPYQNIFYRQEKLTVCEEFCNAWYEACSSASLKGSVIGELYTNGSQFCLKRNFQCKPMTEGHCFMSPSLARTSRAHRHFLSHVCIIITSIAMLFTYLFVNRSYLHPVAAL